MPIEERFVLLIEFVPRVHDPVRDVTIVRQQQQSLGVAIEPPDRNHPPLNTHQVHDGIAPTLVGCRRDIALGLVKQQVSSSRIGDELAVDFDLLPLPVDLRPHLGDDLTVDAHAPFRNQLLRPPA